MLMGEAMYLNGSVHKLCCLRKRIDPHPTLGSEKLGTGRKIPAPPFSGSDYPPLAQHPNTSGQ